MPPQNTAEETAKGAAVGASVGLGLWGLVVPVVNAIGFTASGISGGSTAAAMMSAAAAANGGGVAAGSTVAILQSVGAVGLATPVGLGLVAAGVLAGAIGVGIKTLISETEKSKRHGKLADTSEDEAEQVAENEPWLLLEWLPYSADPTQTYFETEHQASDAYNMSPILEKVLLGPDRRCVQSSV
jgi:hypothetical protein